MTAFIDARPGTSGMYLEQRQNYARPAMTERQIGTAGDHPFMQATNEGVGLDQWVLELLADPMTKLPATPHEIGILEGGIDARRFLRNTIGFVQWDDGQSAYEGWERSTIEDYKKERDIDAPVYDHLKMSGRVGEGNRALFDYLLLPAASVETRTVRFSEKSRRKYGIDRFEHFPLSFDRSFGE